MCHYEERSWMDATIEEESAAEESDDDKPSFLNEEGSDTELLTDGGDEE